MEIDRRVRPFCLTAFFLAATTVALAQMQPVARYKGEMLPVVDCSDVCLYVLKDGLRRETGYQDYTIRPATAFASGFIEIQNVKVDLDPLRNAAASERAKPDSINFRYEADLSSDRDLKRCYALLTFVAKGSVGTWLVPVGRLHKGETEHVKVAFRDRADAVGSLHVFSEGVEVLSTQVQKPYDVREYYASLLRGSPEPSALELVKTDRVFPHVLSNDGRRLATIRDRDTHYSLIVYDLEGKKLLCDVAVGSYNYEVTDLTWVSDHELAFILKRALMLLDVNTGKYEQCEDRVAEIIMSVKKQSQILVLLESGRGASTTKYDIRTRHRFERDELVSGYTLYDEAGEQRVNFYNSRDERAFRFAPKGTSDFQRLDKHVREKGLKFDVPVRDLLDRVADVHAIGPDGDILYISSRLKSDVFQLAAFSMSEGVIKQTIASHPLYDLADSDAGYTRLLFRKGSSELIGIIYEAERPEVIWLDPGFRAVQEAMDKTLAGHVNLPVDWSVDGDTFIFFSFSDGDPGTYYIFRPLQSMLMPLLKLGDRLKEKKMAHTAPFDFAARDGAVVHGYVTYPPVPEPGLPPLVVDIHGGPMSRDVWRFNAENQFLATRGYVVLQVNYRGSSGYGATYQKAGLRARLDTVVIDDIADGVRHLIKEGKVDPSRIGVIGASFGGWATYMSLIRYPDLYRTGVAISAVSHWRNFLKDDRWKYDNMFSYTYWKSLLDSQGFTTDEAMIDPLLRAAELKQPIYVIHGTLDHIVSVEEATTMTKTLQKTNSQVESLIFPYAGHTYDEWGFFDKVRRLNEIGEFLDRHLKAGTPAAAADRGAQPAPEAGTQGVEVPGGVTPPASSSAEKR
jgi:pimeloyl-ACP methyl ester carboxylesterase